MLADGTENLSPEKQAKLALVRRRWLDDQADAADEDDNNYANGGKRSLHVTEAESMKQSEYPTADATETFYSEYSQSWRLMGFYIDCDADEDGHRRKLEGDDDEAGCERYLLWAAVSA